MPRDTRGLRKGGGRPKGVPNKVTLEVRAAAEKLVTDVAYRQGLQERLIAGKAPHMETLLWHYAYGKPADHLRVGDSEGRPMAPITFIVKGRTAA